MPLRPIPVALVLVGGLLAAGCGPSGKIASYNPSDEHLVIRIGALDEPVGPGQTTVLRWYGSPFTLEVLDPDGAVFETVEPTPEKGQRWLFHQLQGTRCFGYADFSNLYGAGTDGALDGVGSIQAAPWTILDREMDFWPGQKMPTYIEQEEEWGMVEIPCGMTVDAANTHAAIHAVIDDLKPK